MEPRPSFVTEIKITIPRCKILPIILKLLVTSILPWSHGFLFFILCYFLKAACDFSEAKLVSTTSFSRQPLASPMGHKITIS